MPEPRSHRTILDLARLPRGPQHFELRPEAPERALLAEELAINAVRKLRFAGTLEPEGARDWRLVAELGATVVQPCVVTLAPVTTRIDTHVTRGYLADWQEPTGEEAEMPEDDDAEPLPDTVDLMRVLEEALALSLPAFPRAPGVVLGEIEARPPGAAPIEADPAERPFAALAELKKRLDG
ncbi:MAG: putative ACR protein [Rhodobacteraceae bacterium HLUCCO18]|nr:MAG: putative ACR protein [Rhodobacteraceae bacterium HLUCCO18]